MMASNSVKHVFSAPSSTSKDLTKTDLKRDKEILSMYIMNYFRFHVPFLSYALDVAPDYEFADVLNSCVTYL